MQAKERLIKIVQKVVEERQVTTTEMPNSPANDAVDVLLRDVNDGGCSDKQSHPLDFISGKIVEMMIPGEETMPTAMTLAVKFLSDNPVALAKLVVRIDIQTSTAHPPHVCVSKCKLPTSSGP